MGGSISVIKNTNEMVNEQMTKVMTNSFSSCDMSSEQSQTAVISGNKNADVEIDQNMLLKVLATCEITTTITNDIKNNIDTFLKEKLDVETGAPLVGLNYTSTEFLNRIRNTIKNEISTETVSKIMQKVNALQSALVADNEGGNYKVTQQMTGDIVLTALITNNVINKALSELKAQLELDASISNLGSNWNIILYIIIGLCVLLGCYYGLPVLFGMFSNDKKNNRNYDEDNGGGYDENYGDGYRR